MVLAAARFSSDDNVQPIAAMSMTTSKDDEGKYDVDERGNIIGYYS